MAISGFSLTGTTMDQVNGSENDFSDAFTVGKYKLKLAVCVYETTLEMKNGSSLKWNQLDSFLSFPISEPATGSITGFWWKIKITSELLDEWWVVLELSTPPPKWGYLFDIFAMISIYQSYHRPALQSSRLDPQVQ